MKYAVRYIRDNLSKGTVDSRRFDAPEQAEVVRNNMFQPQNWEVVSIETMEVITSLVPKTTTVWVAA